MNHQHINSTPNSPQLFLGVMSGSSNDGVDIALVAINKPLNRSLNIQTLATQCFSYPANYYTLFKTLQKMTSINQLIELEYLVSVFFSQCITQFLSKHDIAPSQCVATGIHGPTIYHQTNNNTPFSKQLGNAGWIAQQTNITTVSDFRINLIAQGLEGAPLAPIFHDVLFAKFKRPLVILNIGGIANMTYLGDKEVFGFDIGPGNVMLDQWAKHSQKQPFDDQGLLARSGKICLSLLQTLWQYTQNHCPARQSIGPNIFILEYLKQQYNQHSISQKDMQNTLTELSALCIAKGVKSNTPKQVVQLHVCGGGVYNYYLMERIAHHLPTMNVQSTQVVDIHPMYVEASGFAYLAFKNVIGESIIFNNQRFQLGGTYCSYK